MQNKEVRDRQEMLLKKKEFIENKYPSLLKLMHQYNQLTQAQKDLLLKDWNSYYEMVLESKAYKRFKTMKRMWGKEVLKEYVIKAREQKEAQDWEIPVPAIADPLWLQNNQTLNEYRRVCSELNDNQKKLEDYEVFSV